MPNYFSRLSSRKTFEDCVSRNQKTIRNRGDEELSYCDVIVQITAAAVRSTTYLVSFIGSSRDYSPSCARERIVEKPLRKTNRLRNGTIDPLNRNVRKESDRPSRRRRGTITADIERIFATSGHGSRNAGRRFFFWLCCGRKPRENRARDCASTDGRKDDTATLSRTIFDIKFLPFFWLLFFFSRRFVRRNNQLSAEQLQDSFRTANIAYRALTLVVFITLRRSNEKKSRWS